jgi:flagellar motor switch protein FliN/FliY
MNHNPTLNLTPLDRFSDLSVMMQVRIGHRTMSVREVSMLKTGSVFVLDKPAGEALDLMIGNVVLASAEVVVIEDRLAVRITEFDLRHRPEPALADDGMAVPTDLDDTATDAVDGSAAALDDAVACFVGGLADALAAVVESMIDKHVHFDWQRIERPLRATPQDDWLWLSETFSIFPTTALWIGGSRASWDSIGQSILSSLGVEQAEAEVVEATCRDIVAQSASALAQKLAKQVGAEITSGDASPASAPAMGSFVALTLKPPGVATEISLIAAVDESFLRRLSGGLGQSSPRRRSNLSALPPSIASLRLRVHVALGRTKLMLQEVFAMAVGSVIELGRSVTDPVDILVNDSLIARGQVVLCGNSYGVKIVSNVSRNQSGSGN